MQLTARPVTLTCRQLERNTPFPSRNSGQLRIGICRAANQGLFAGDKMPKVRNISRHQAKRTSTVALVLSMLLMLTIVLLMLLALGILSLPIASDDDSSPIRDRITFKRRSLVMYVYTSQIYCYLRNLIRFFLFLFICIRRFGSYLMQW